MLGGIGVSGAVSGVTGGKLSGEIGCVGSYETSGPCDVVWNGNSITCAGIVGFTVGAVRSTRHMEEQPSSLRLFASSQVSSGVSVMPSPQRAGEQSGRQFAFALFVLSKPSSQSSPVSRMPSPQYGVPSVGQLPSVRQSTIGGTYSPDENDRTEREENACTIRCDENSASAEDIGPSDETITHWMHGNPPIGTHTLPCALQKLSPPVAHSFCSHCAPTTEDALYAEYAEYAYSE